MAIKCPLSLLLKVGHVLKNELAKAPVGAFANSVVRNLYSLDYGIVSDV